MKSPITKEQLIEWGMIETSDPIYPLEKILGESGEVGRLAIVLTLEKNSQNFAIKLPDGATLFINPLTIDDLKKLEELIYSYEPVW